MSSTSPDRPSFLSNGPALPNSPLAQNKPTPTQPSSPTTTSSSTPTNPLAPSDGPPSPSSYGPSLQPHLQPTLSPSPILTLSPLKSESMALSRGRRLHTIPLAPSVPLYLMSSGPTPKLSNTVLSEIHSLILKPGHSSHPTPPPMSLV
ncbi:hypothetical protein V2J09_003564 [Rumex salicifolius]